MVKNPGLAVWKKRGYVWHRQIISALGPINQQPESFARNVSEAIWEHLASAEPSSMTVTSLLASHIPDLVDRRNDFQVLLGDEA